MADVIILGNGPAGISASLYTARAGLDTLIIGSGGGSLKKTGSIENYYGFPEPIPGKDLIKNGITQAKRLGISIIEDEVVGISYDGSFSVKTKSGDYLAPFAVMATGSSRHTPKIEGIKEFEGKGVSYCAVCDGFFYRKKEVAVLGCGEYALHEASELLPIAGNVTVLTNGGEASAEFPPEMGINKKEISSLVGENGVLKSVRFSDGASLPISGLFVAVGVAGSTDLAKKIGAETNGAYIVTDGNKRTNIPNLYAAGDCTGGMLQVSKAVYDGAVAGTNIVKEFRKQKK